MSWDFQSILHIDVTDYVNGFRSWDEFFVYFNYLPESSKTKSAILQDPEYAKAQVSMITEKDIQDILDARAERKRDVQDMTTEGYTLEIAKLNEIIDGLKILNMSIRGAFGGKSAVGEFEPAPRPRTEYQRLLDDKIHAYEERDKNDMLKSMGF